MAGKCGYVIIDHCLPQHTAAPFWATFRTIPAAREVDRGKVESRSTADLLAMMTAK